MMFLAGSHESILFHSLVLMKANSMLSLLRSGWRSKLKGERRDPQCSRWCKFGDEDYRKAPPLAVSQVALGVKNLPTNAGNVRDMSSIPGSRRSPGGGNSSPLQYSCLNNPMDRGAWWATVYGVTKSLMWLKWLSTHASISYHLIKKNGGIPALEDIFTQ